MDGTGAGLLGLVNCLRRLLNYCLMCCFILLVYFRVAPAGLTPRSVLMLQPPSPRNLRHKLPRV